MSAIRSSASTRAQRSYSPYGRPRPKKSTWSFSSLFSIFNPLRSASSQDTDAQSESGSEPEDFDSPEPDSTPMQQSTPAHALADVGHRMSQNIASTPQWASMPPPPPPPAPSAGPSTLPFPPSSESPEKNIEYVAEFLRGKQDGLISEADRNKLVSLLSSSSRQLQQSSPTIREPFRFTHSPSPMRGNTPLPTTNPSPHDRSASPTKMLAKNPNGSYRWNGGGSAKKRTRYQSPAFAPTRSASEQLVLRPSSTDASKTDTKRRRVSISTVAPPAQPASSSASPNTPIRSSRSPAPDPSPTRIATSSIIPVTGPMSPSRSMSSINGNSAPKPNALALSASTSRLSASTRFTTPVVPSPLRQAWGQASPGSVSSSSPDTTPQKQTKAANLMAELIKDATPSRNMDISNPYQSASPARPGRPKRNRITAKPPPPARRAIEEVKKSPEPPLTAHAIIEATVPKGSKRSRPPPSAKTNGHPAFTNGHQNHDEDEDERASKKTKPSELERVDTDISMESTSAKTSSTSTLGSFTSRPVASKAFPIPKEPSKLRYSFQPDTPPTPTPETVSSPAPPVVPTSAPPPPAADTPWDPKSEAAKVPVNDLPKYDFARCMVPTTSVSCDKATWEEVYIMADEELPSYDFSVRKTFDFKAAGMKAPEASGKWTCSQCCLENDNAAAEKCVICEAPRESKSAPAPPPPPPSSGEAKVFDWAAAGLEAPRRSADAWTCSVCSLGNTGGSKCFICDSPRV